MNNNKVKPGDFVILNECDCPCTRLIALVDEVIGNAVQATYICRDTNMIKCGSTIDRVTKVEDFGIAVKIDHAKGTVEGIQVKESIATYSDGKVRMWQPEGCETQKLKGFLRKPNDKIMTPLFIPLKTEYYELFESGRKKAELRKYGPRWNERTCSIGREVILSKGYGKNHRITGRINDFKKKPACDIDPIHRLAIQTIYGDLDIDIAVIYIECDNKQGLQDETTTSSTEAH